MPMSNCACTPCVLLFCACFIWSGNRRTLSTWDHFCCMVEPSLSHVWRWLSHNLWELQGMSSRIGRTFEKTFSSTGFLTATAFHQARKMAQRLTFWLRGGVGSFSQGARSSLESSLPRYASHGKQTLSPECPRNSAGTLGVFKRFM